MYTFDDFINQNLAVRFEEAGSDLYMKFVSYLDSKGMRWAGGDNLLTQIYTPGELIFLGNDNNPSHVYYASSEYTWIEKEKYITVMPEEFDFMEMPTPKTGLSLLKRFILGKI